MFRLTASVTAITLIALTCVAARPAAAAVASAANSSADSYVVFCPAGDLVFHMVSRDASNLPEVDHDLDLEVCDCPAVVLSPMIEPGTYTLVGCRVRALNQDFLTGAAEYPVRAGGTCSSGIVRLWSGGVLLRSLTGIASTDQDRDLVVGAADRALLEVKVAAGTYDPAADLDGDRDVDAGDLAVLDQHLGHHADMAVPVLPPSWGLLRVRYR